MKIEEYLRMNEKELHKALMFQIKMEPDSSEAMVEELVNSYKYMEDISFCLVVDSCKALLTYIKGGSTELIPVCKDLIERSKKDGICYLHLANQYLLGEVYHRLELFEQALECYRNVIRSEDEIDDYSYLSGAYGNIGLIYQYLADFENALKSVGVAIEIAEKMDSSQPDYLSNLITFKSDYATILCNMHRAAEAFELIREMDKIDKSNTSIIAKFSYGIAKMNYYFNKGTFQEAKEIFYKKREMVASVNPRYKNGLLEIFIELCEEFSLPYSDFYDELLEAYEHIEFFGLETEIRVYRCLRGYYLEKGEEKKAINITNKYIESLGKKDTLYMSKRRESLGLVNQLINECQALSQIESKNSELEQVLAYGDRHKKALQEVYQRIELINELGKRVTSSLNLSTVIEMTYNNLCDTIHIDAFLIVVAEPEHNRLKSVAYYNDKVLQPEVMLDLDQNDSVLVECYKTKRTILSENIHEDERFKHIQLRNCLNDIKSVIFIPLRIGEQLVGVLSAQSKEKATYNYDHVMLLEGLVPYLSIALNNAIYSQKLEYEIKAHLETQAELRKANDKLEALSALDGLTRISNRRDFENKILKLISNAEEEKKTVSVIMVDIDNFKLYNDNYGHLAGDEALKIVAKVIRENLDMVEGLSARFGGEEFVCACSGLSIAEARTLGEKLCKDVYAKQIEHIKVPNGIMSISVGVAFTDKATVDLKSELMKQADVSLYEAKNTGKNKAIIKEIL